MEVDNSTSFDEAFADDERTDIITTPVKASSVPKDLPLVTYDTPPNSRTFDLSPSDTNSDKKKRIRRNKKGGKHHRKWKPYNKLSWDERKVLEEKESKKAALMLDSVPVPISTGKINAAATIPIVPTCGNRRPNSKPSAAGAAAISSTIKMRGGCT